MKRPGLLLLLPLLVCSGSTSKAADGMKVVFEGTVNYMSVDNVDGNSTVMPGVSLGDPMSFEFLFDLNFDEVFYPTGSAVYVWDEHYSSGTMNFGTYSVHTEIGEPYDGIDERSFVQVHDNHTPLEERYGFQIWYQYLEDGPFLVDSGTGAYLLSFTDPVFSGVSLDRVANYPLSSFEAGDLYIGGRFTDTSGGTHQFSVWAEVASYSVTAMEVPTIPEPATAALVGLGLATVLTTSLAKIRKA